MGFDDLEISQYLTPGLTTVKQEISLKGEKAVELLIRNINEPELTKQELILPVSLVESGSVKRAVPADNAGLRRAADPSRLPGDVSACVGRRRQASRLTGEHR